MSVDTDWDLPFFPGMGGSVDPDAPVITFPVNGLTVPPVHNVSGTAQPGQTVTLWSALNGGALAQHDTTTADAQGAYVFTGSQITGRDGDVATFEVRTDTGTSADVTVTVRGPVLDSIAPTSATTDIPHTFILTGSRFLTMPTALVVRVSDPSGVRRIDPSSQTATQVTVEVTFSEPGEAKFSLSEAGDGNPVLTDELPVTVTAAEVLAVHPGDVLEDVAHDDEGVEPDPATLWATGESALFSDGEWHWDGAGWLEGAA